MDVTAFIITEKVATNATNSDINLGQARSQNVQISHIVVNLMVLFMERHMPEMMMVWTYDLMEFQEQRWK
jgi:hypothetical protein